MLTANEINEVSCSHTGQDLSTTGNRLKEVWQLHRITNHNFGDLLGAAKTKEALLEMLAQPAPPKQEPEKVDDGLDEVFAELREQLRKAKERKATLTPTPPETIVVQKAKVAKGTRNKWAGHTITSKVTTNPRKAGTHGYKAFQFILDNGGKATYEEYRAAGHTNNHLVWDLNKGNLTIEPNAETGS